MASVHVKKYQRLGSKVWVSESLPTTSASGRYMSVTLSLHRVSLWRYLWLKIRRKT